MANESYTIGILLFEDAEELDWAGPYEVFGMASIARDDARIVTVAETSEPVRSFNGLRVLPDFDFASVPALDVVVVPGGQGTRKQVDNAVLTGWLADIAPGCRWETALRYCSAVTRRIETGPPCDCGSSPPQPIWQAIIPKSSNRRTSRNADLK